MINEKTTVTNKERSPEENSVRGPLGSRGTELYRVVRILRFWPTAADYILLIYPENRGELSPHGSDCSEE